MKNSSWTIFRLSLIVTLLAASAPLARADVIDGLECKGRRDRH